MSVLIASRRHSRLSRDFPDALIFDVTSQGAEPWIRLSLFYPHGRIPCRAPGPDLEIRRRNLAGAEGVRYHPEDFTKLDVTTMKAIKRTARGSGCRLDGRRLGYEEVRQLIYLPTYHWMPRPSGRPIPRAARRARQRPEHYLTRTRISLNYKSIFRPTIGGVEIHSKTIESNQRNVKMLIFKCFPPLKVNPTLPFCSPLYRDRSCR